MIYYEKKSDIVVLTTAFDVTLTVARNFFNSLVIQTKKNFDVFIVNDGFKQMELIRKEFPSLYVIELEGVGIISKNRELMINMTREVYKYGIFCDFDDFFSDDRVNISVELLKRNDVVVNDVDIYRNGEIIEKSLFSNNLSNGQELSIDDILQCNYFGMSNTAVNMNLIPRVNFDSRLRAVDWYFFSLLLLNGTKAIFNNQMSTIYRQHDSNIANISCNDLTQFSNELKVKDIHYDLLSSKNEIYVKLLGELRKISKQVEGAKSDFSLKQLDYYDSSAKSWWSLINININR